MLNDKEIIEDITIIRKKMPLIIDDIPTTSSIFGRYGYIIIYKGIEIKFSTWINLDNVFKTLKGIKGVIEKND